MKRRQLLTYDQSLKRKRSRHATVEDVMSLYRLLPIQACHRDVSFLENGTLDLTSLATARSSSLALNFLKKFKGFKSPLATQNAKDKFWKYEDRCLLFNEKFRSYRQQPEKAFLQSVLFTAQRKVASILGVFNEERYIDLCRWGPRTTSSCSMNSVSSPEKFGARPDVTPDLLFFARHSMRRFPSWSALLANQDYGFIGSPMFNLRNYNKVAFVPKTAKIDRTIAVEPHINTFFQNGLGRYIRERLLKSSVDLTDQTLNQRLAMLGSCSNDLATIDLEGASDTICVELVRDLLPEDWFFHLDMARSKEGKCDEKVFSYQKFSSMGNGATFDLESLIFYALSWAVSELKGYNSFWVNVFGDDIVVPSGIYDDVADILDQCGFIINQAKSFHNSPFRESCGKDYYLGRSVRSAYLKEVPDDQYRWIQTANKIRLLAREFSDDTCCSKSFKPAYDFALSRIEIKNRIFRVPLGYGDTGLISNFDEACPTQARDGWSGFITTAIKTIAVTKKLDCRSLVTSGCQVPSELGNQVPRVDQYLYGKARLFIFNEWIDIGGWC